MADETPATSPVPPPAAPSPPPGTPLPLSAGEKAKARDILAAIKTLRQVEHEHRPANAPERETLGRFPGFGAVAISIFPNPGTGAYKDESWRAVGEELTDRCAKAVELFDP